MGLHPEEALVSELMTAFRVRFGGSNSEFMMASELLELCRLLDAQEALIGRLMEDRHRAFHREPPREVSHV